MGIISGYLLYRAGRRRGERRLELEGDLEDDGLICDNCGLPLGYHANDVRRSCPTHRLEVHDEF
jgi:hypothetical protein